MRCRPSPRRQSSPRSRRSGSTRLPPDRTSRARSCLGSADELPDLQGRMPTFAQYTDTSPLCATYADASGNRGAQVTVAAQLPPPPDSASGGANSVDQLIFPPGGAALAGVLPSTGKGDAVNTIYL